MNTPTLKNVYQEVALPELMKKFGYKNALQAPRLEKITINSGVSANFDKAAVDETAKDVGLITGQKPVTTKARMSISNFKVREGMPVGVKVTLRGRNMWEFAYRMMNIALPNIRDFRGVNTKLDGQGNYTLGIADHTIFPEISVEGNRRTIGMDICFKTSATTDEEGRELLRLLGMPFRKSQSQSATQAA